jgi:beta-glucosidase
MLPFQNPDLPLEERLDDLLSRLTLEEKVDCLSTRPHVPRLGIRASGHVEGLHGLAQGGPAAWGKPVMTPTTTFPQAKGLAETWDPELVSAIAVVEAKECRHIFHHPSYERGGIVVRAPNADLGRDPRWGRTEECYGEDAYLSGVMTVAFVKGLQGDHPRVWQTAALLKHFLANSNENGREKSSSDFDDRLLREYYSVPFREGIVRGGARAYMAAYNAYNGIPCATHPILLSMTVAEWGNDGIICTDGGAFKMLVTDHQFYPDLPQAAAACVRAGITQFLDDYKESLEKALAQGLVSEADLDVAVRKDFRVMARLGLLDPPGTVPYADVEGAPDPWESEEHRALARRATQRSVVLLKNRDDFLPLDAGRLQSIAVLGPRADQVLLDWYSGTPPYTVTPLEGIRRRVGEGVLVHHAAGDDLAAAVRAARDADVAIVCVGNHPTGDAGWAVVTLPSYGKEAVDRQSLALEEEDLVRAVHEANPNTVVVLVSSFPYTINWCEEHVPAIVHVTHNSQELGNGLAAILFGDDNPAGRLVETWPRSIEQLPPMMDYDIRHGRTYLYFEGEPLYPFGHGLSYATFAYGKLRTASDRFAAADAIAVSFDVTNTSARAGDEVAQLYVRHLDSRVSRPKRELKAFRRVPLRAGETKTVVLSVAVADLAYWDVTLHAFVVETGAVELLVGRSSSRIELTKTVSIVGSEN